MDLLSLRNAFSLLDYVHSLLSCILSPDTARIILSYFANININQNEYLAIFTMKNNIKCSGHFTAFNSIGIYNDFNRFDIYPTFNPLSSFMCQNFLGVTFAGFKLGQLRLQTACGLFPNVFSSLSSSNISNEDISLCYSYPKNTQFNVVFRIEGNVVLTYDTSSFLPSSSNIEPTTAVNGKKLGHRLSAYLLETDDFILLPMQEQINRCGLVCSHRYGLAIIGGYNPYGTYRERSSGVYRDIHHLCCDEKYSIRSYSSNSHNRTEVQFEWKSGYIPPLKFADNDINAVAEKNKNNDSNDGLCLLPRLNEGRSNLSVLTFDNENKIFVVGGWRSGDLNSAEIYNYECMNYMKEENDDNSQILNGRKWISTAHTNCKAVTGAGLCHWTAKDKVVMVGGARDYHQMHAELYDMNKDIWLKLPNTKKSHIWYPALSMIDENLVKVMGSHYVYKDKNQSNSDEWGYAEILDLRDYSSGSHEWRVISEPIAKILNFEDPQSKMMRGIFKI